MPRSTAHGSSSISVRVSGAAVSRSAEKACSHRGASSVSVSIALYLLGRQPRAHHLGTAPITSSACTALRSAILPVSAPTEAGGGDDDHHSRARREPFPQCRSVGMKRASPLSERHHAYIGHASAHL